MGHKLPLPTPGRSCPVAIALDIMLLGFDHMVSIGSIPDGYSAFLETENAAKIQQKYSEYTGTHTFINLWGPIKLLWVPSQVSGSSLDHGFKL